MTPSSVSTERDQGIAVLRLDRPPANAFSLELARDLGAALDGEAARAAAALVLTGAGSFFSGGLDLRLVPAYSRAEQRDLLTVVNRLLGRLYSWPVPVVAAVNGHAMAAAVVLALAADYRVGASEGARFGLTEARVGIPFPAVPMIVLQAELAPQDVRWAALGAWSFGPEEALRRGILDELQPPGAVLGRAIAVARDLASQPADSYRRIKHQVRADAMLRIEQVCAAGSDPMLEGWLSRDARSASAATLGGGSTARSDV